MRPALSRVARIAVALMRLVETPAMVDGCIPASRMVAGAFVADVMLACVLWIV